MSADLSWLAALLATDAPALPGVLWMQYYLPMSWIIPLSLFGALVGWKLPWRARKYFALGFGAVAVTAGSAFPMYWLGLAFQTLSFSAVFLVGLPYSKVLAQPGKLEAWPRADGISLWFLLAAVLPGYLLLLDTFAVLPWQIYAWGFSPMALICLLAVSLLPGVLHGFTLPQSKPEVWVAPTALLLFAVTRLPTGNVWDALIDPWLWLFLNGVLLRTVYRRWRDAKALTPQI
jgi:hypothetical protein